MTATPSFTRVATVTASTKRKAAVNVSTGLGGSLATNLASLACVPLHPADNAMELRQTLVVDALHELWQTFVQNGLDIISGDILVIGSVEYPIRLVQPRPFGRVDTRLQIIVEVLRN